MTTVKVHAEIGPDGKLRLEIPIGLPAGHAEVLVVVQPEGNNGHKQVSSVGSARSGLFASKTGQNLDVDAALKEMNDAWRLKFTDPS